MAKSFDELKDNVINNFNNLGNTSCKLFDYIGKIESISESNRLDSEYNELYSMYRDLLDKAIISHDVKEFMKRYKVLDSILDKVIKDSEECKSLSINYILYLDKIEELKKEIDKLVLVYNESVDNYNNKKQGLFSKKVEKEHFDFITL